MKITHVESILLAVPFEDHGGIWRASGDRKVFQTLMVRIDTDQGICGSEGTSAAAFAATSAAFSCAVFRRFAPSAVYAVSPAVYQAPILMDICSC